MEETKVKKNNKGLIAIIILLLISNLCLIVYIHYSSKDLAPKEQSNENTSETPNIVKKLDDTKDWIYNAEYEKNVDADYSGDEFHVFYAKDLIVPYINVDSEYAKKANDEMKKLFDQAVKDFNDEIANNNHFIIDDLSYTKYVEDDVLSTKVIYSFGETAISDPTFYTYNIDLKTGEELTYEEVYKLAGFTDSNIEEAVIKAITVEMHNQLSYIDTTDSYPEGENFDTYNNQSIELYKESVANKSIKYFLTDNAKLNIIVTLSIPAGQGGFTTVVSVG